MQHFHFVAFEGRSSWSSRAATCPCFSGTQHLLCELSVLDIEAELDWDPAVGNINQAPVSLYDDGGVLYFK